MPRSDMRGGLHLNSPPGRWLVRAMYFRAAFLWLAKGSNRPQEQFSFRDSAFQYFHHRYNVTWLNERCVEIPLAFSWLETAKNRSLLEVGNVLSHYRQGLKHTVVDLYEGGRNGVHTADARFFDLGEQYDFIISISTLEHVGWDETPRNPDKAWETILHLRSLLKPGGVFYFTTPFGYHQHLDEAIRVNHSQFQFTSILTRVDARNQWEQVEQGTAYSLLFGSPYPFANSLHICAIGGLEAPLITDKSEAGAGG